MGDILMEPAAGGRGRHVRVPALEIDTDPGRHHVRERRRRRHHVRVAPLDAFSVEQRLVHHSAAAVPQATVTHSPRPAPAPMSVARLASHQEG